MDGKIFNVGSEQKQMIKNIIFSIIKKTSGETSIWKNKVKT